MTSGPGAYDVAVIGMAGRLPGARDLETFWRNLCAGTESISFFSIEEALAAGADPALVRDPGFVPAGGALADIELFDAAFFGYTPKEAEIMDPQHRLFLEHAWQALEAAGYGAGTDGLRVGVYAGASSSSYRHLLEARGRSLDPYQARLENDRDFLATRISYELNLRGPSLTVQTACSTSLVAVHLACQALLNGECDLALAGGVSIRVPQEGGYLYREGGIHSPDGHCRPFDARARGTVGGNGVGLIVLRRLADALSGGDTIRAVIRGSAVNNDGSLKAGFTAPSADGQAAVIAEALGLAQIRPDTLGAIEAHGTATELGDPIEFSALHEVFRRDTRRRGFCALGSVKSNIGHLDAAAGVAGLIKAVLSVERGVIPPSLHFENPNPEIDLADSPFYVNRLAVAWKPEGGPRRAGVSSFGIGGTNAHVVLEEAPPPPPAGPSRPCHLIVLSARTRTALEAAAAGLGAHLRESPGLELADVAYTLQAGRRVFEHRRAFVCRSVQEAVERLEGAAGNRVWTGEEKRRDRPVVFLFPGQGAQYAGMAAGLYAAEPALREEVDRCAERLRSRLGHDLREVLFDREGGARLAQTAVAQPALFVVEHALAKLLAGWGIVPEAMLGHSLGEYVAACLAGVIQLEDALELVALRGELMQELPRGAMLSVRLPEDRLLSRLGGGLSLAALNAPARCVVSGPDGEVERLETELRQEGIACRRLDTSHAFHSEAMQPVLAPFRRAVGRLRLRPPERRYLSNVTGTWATGAEVTDPEYWVRHLRRTVRFGDGVAELLREPDRVFLEVGPGQTLASLVRQGATGSPRPDAFPVLPGGEAPELESLLEGLGQLWLAGGRADWPRFHLAWGARRRIPLPTYPFERKRYWVDEAAAEKPPARMPQGMPAPPPETAVPAGTAVAADPADAIRRQVAGLCSELFGIPAGELDPGASFLELGADSLLLLQLSQTLQARLGVRVPFRQLMEELSSIAVLARWLAERLPPEAIAPAPTLAAATAPAEAPADLEGLLRQQLELTSRMLDLVRTGPPPAAAEGVPQRPAPEAAPAAFGPFKPIKAGTAGGLTPRQQRHLASFTARYTARTGGSKRSTERHRPRLADNRASTGFRLLWKELVYPIVVQRSQGSHLWDVDGNEYVDLNMGFGSNLFGHSPRFVTEALERQLAAGIQIGPQTDLAGEVADLLCELTGNERVSFCNTGTEAVMAAVRIARAVTGRDRIALFSGSYHGHSDGVLARSVTTGGRTRSVPVAPGIPARFVEDVLVLDYGNPEALELVSRHASELAAVLVEPVQSRRPDLQPVEHLRQLRELTRSRGIALIFDEMITGFRIHPGGAQAWFGVQADLVTYGKVVGGGMPLGVLAGRAELMDAVDGGTWNYGDGSYPRADQTFFAGTFCKHPLAMAAARAVLEHLKEAGPSLQEELNRRTAGLVADLNAWLAAEELPFRASSFASLFRLTFPPDLAFPELLFYHLLERGIYLAEGRGCFLSTAHSDEDLDRVRRALGESAEELRKEGFLPTKPQVAVPAPPREVSLPLMASQQGIWVAAQMEEGASLAYNESVVLRFRGELDAAALRRAFRATVARHEALRTTFAPDGDRQLVHAALPFELATVDLSGLPESEKAAAERDWLESGSGVPFDLVQGPLVRAGLARRSPREHCLLFTVHHGVFDGLSAGLVFSDLAALYSAERRGASACLPEPASWSAYVERRLEGEAGGAAGEDEAFWRHELAGLPPEARPPADRGRLSARKRRGERAAARIGPDLTASLRTLGARHGLTLLNSLLAGYFTLLARLTGQDDLVVGIGSAGRHQPEDWRVVGLCVTMLPLRCSGFAAMPFSEHARAVRRRVLDAFEHERISLLRLSKDLGLPGRSSLVRVMFNLDQVGSSASGDLGFEGLEVEEATSPAGAPKLDLVLNVVDRGHELSVEATFDGDLWDAVTVRRWLNVYETLLRSACEEPGRPVSELPLLAPAERHQILIEVNDTGTDYPAEVPIARLFEIQADGRPEAPAVVFGGAELTYRELDRRANRLARSLRSRGVDAEARVAIALERSAEMIVAMLAVLKAGGAYLLLDVGSPPERLAFLLADSGAVLVVTREGLLDHLPGSGPGVVCLDRDAVAVAREREDRLPASGTGAHLACVVYTSGSTGRPKGIEIVQRSVARLVLNSNYLRILPGDRVAQASNASFDAATFEVWGALLQGATLVGLSRETMLSPREFSRELAAQRVSVILLTTALFNRLTRAEPGVLASLRCVLFGGEAVDPDRVREVLAEGAPDRLLHVYGPAESTTLATWYRVSSVAAGAATVPIGHALSNTRTYVIDRWGNPVLPGAAGELWIGGDGLARGYLRRPDLTAERFVPDAWSGEPGERLYRTGDLVRRRPDGALEFLGRIDHQIKLRGFRIEPGEIEVALCEHPQVSAAVVVVQEKDGDKRLVGYAAAEAGLTAGELRQFLRLKLPDYMVPAVLVLLDELPLNANGKVDRHRLPAPDGARPAAEQRPFEEPRTAGEIALAKIWSEVLQVERVSRDDNFFDLGGDSLRAIRVLQEAKSVFAGEISFRTLFESPTLAELCAAMERAGGSPERPAAATTLVRVPRRSATPLAPDPRADQRTTIEDGPA